MRRRALVLAAIALAAAAPAAVAQSPGGIVRPGNERALTPIQLGAALYAGNCATCHGIAGHGIYSRQARAGVGEVHGEGPSLRDAGAQAADFYLRTGYMPLPRPGDQPKRSRVLFSEREVRALIAYVASLGNGPQVPVPHPEQGSLSEGLRLFTQHCAGCHQVVAQGGVVTGARVPPLKDATPVQIAEAVRIGPYLMPRFSERDITPAQLDSLVRYVLLTQHPPDRGGWGIGNIGPFPEGMVTWLLATFVLIATCMVIGRRLRS
ncbi:MAG TPA: c-type cytochrome [Gaiellales bacterium]|nr:c-type cytochrome [Gaiellales bacterium]